MVNDLLSLTAGLEWTSGYNFPSALRCQAEFSVIYTRFSWWSHKADSVAVVLLLRLRLEAPTCLPDILSTQGLQAAELDLNWAG